MATLQMGDMISKVSSTAHDISWLTGAAGFIYGVDYKWLGQNGGFYPYTSQGLLDLVASIAGQKAARMISPSYSGIATQTFNLGAALNKYTGAAVLLYGAKEVFPNKWTRLAWNVAGYFLLAAGVGRIFDDPPYSVGNYTSNGQTYGASGPNRQVAAPNTASSWIGVYGNTWTNKSGH